MNYLLPSLLTRDTVSDPRSDGFARNSLNGYGKKYGSSKECENDGELKKIEN